MKMDSIRFEALVLKAVESLPDEFASKLENVDVVVEDQPSQALLAKMGLPRGHTLLGLYQGIPLNRRGRGYGMVIPDKVTIFQQPIEAKCRYEADIVKEVRKVVLHEIAHHFGITDARLIELEQENS